MPSSFLPYQSRKARESPETYVKKPKKPLKERRAKGNTPKAPRKPKAPKTRCSRTMTEAQFWQFIRSALRSKSRRWAPVYECLKDARRASKSDNKRQKWEYQCNHCKQWFPAKEVSVDHIISAGSLRCGADLEGFVERLFCEKNGLQVLCLSDHQAKTNQERKNE